MKSTRGVRERSPGRSPVSPMRPGESPDGQERRRRCPTFLPENQATQDVEFSPMSRGIASHRGPGTLPAEESQQSPVATGGGGLDPPDYAVRLAMEPFLQNMAQVVGEQWEYAEACATPCYKNELLGSAWTLPTRLNKHNKLHYTVSSHIKSCTAHSAGGQGSRAKTKRFFVTEGIWQGKHRFNTQGLYACLWSGHLYYIRF